MAEYLNEGKFEYGVDGPETDYVDGPTNVAPVDGGFEEDLEPDLEETVGDVADHHP